MDPLISSCDLIAVHYAVLLTGKYIIDGWRTFAVEAEVDILDAEGEPITKGTIDLVLERNREYLIIDWKTGDKADYSAQLAGYLSAWWDLHPEAKTVHCLVVYVDLRETQNCNTSYSEASARTLNLFDNMEGKRK